MHIIYTLTIFVRNDIYVVMDVAILLYLLYKETLNLSYTCLGNPCLKYKSFR